MPDGGPALPQAGYLMRLLQADKWRGSCLVNVAVLRLAAKHSL
jgi:hypothetical protein